MEKHTYQVGVMSSARYVEAPNGRAAALYFGIHTNGGQLMAAVYEEDGKEYQGEATPWMAYMFDPQGPDKIGAALDEVMPMMEQCRFVPSPQAWKAARAANIEGAEEDEETLFQKAMAIERELFW